MTTKYERYTVQAEGLTLAKICWRRFRQPYPGIVERILDEQPGLAGLGVRIPVGTLISIPIENPRPQHTTSVVTLWD